MVVSAHKAPGPSQLVGRLVQTALGAPGATPSALEALVLAATEHAGLANLVRDERVVRDTVKYALLPGAARADPAGRAADALLGLFALAESDAAEVAFAVLNRHVRARRGGMTASPRVIASRKYLEQLAGDETAPARARRIARLGLAGDIETLSRLDELATERAPRVREWTLRTEGSGASRARFVRVEPGRRSGRSNEVRDLLRRAFRCDEVPYDLQDEATLRARPHRDPRVAELVDAARSSDLSEVELVARAQALLRALALPCPVQPDPGKPNRGGPRVLPTLYLRKRDLDTKRDTKKGRVRGYVEVESRPIGRSGRGISIAWVPLLETLERDGHLATKGERDSRDGQMKALSAQAREWGIAMERAPGGWKSAEFKLCRIEDGQADSADEAAELARETRRAQLLNQRESQMNRQRRRG